MQGKTLTKKDTESLHGAYSSKKDCVLGELLEDVIISYLTHHSAHFGMVDVGIKNRTNTYDFALKEMLNGNLVTFEAKSDLYNKVDVFGDYSENMAIEIAHNNKPSGLSVTTAEYFVYYYFHREELWIIKMKDFKEKILNNKKVNRISAPNSGDKKNTHLLLYQRYNINKCFSIYKIDIYNDFPLMREKLAKTMRKLGYIV